MEMHQVRYFLAVCKSRNFTRAAERCHVSQPALTTAIRKLEEELGGELFHRERGQVLLTVLGESLRPHFEQMFSEVDAVTAAAERHRLLDHVPLRIGVLSTIGPSRVSDLIATFRRGYPGVDVALSAGSMESLRDQLDRDLIDLAIMATRDSHGHADAGIDVRPLYTESYRVVLPPGHRLLGRDEIRLAELSGELYVDRLACEMREVVMEICEGSGLEFYASVRSEREDWIEGLVAAGLGFALLPEFSIEASRDVSRPLVEPEVTREVSLFSPVRRVPSKAAQVFLAIIDA